MASLPSQHPTLSLHLSDSTLTPLITSASSQSHLESLTALTSSALSSQTAAQRLGLGRPQRLMVEYPDRGPVVLHSYLDPRDAVDTTTNNNTAVAASSRPGSAPGSSHGADPRAPRSVPAPTSHHDPRSEDAAPPLVGVVVAGSADEAREARRASARLERVGREIQKEWAAESSQERTNEDAQE
ncbi:uncharacterized protein FIESC28_02420 [Fusarium coffeatum]|uniref:Uncharacterized protein n=2 Tax=Fusarium incarnatum-equiseti species complex TaxID=450425 RepID=A0A9W8PHA5_9HYPO|nr:uncharacterized protein FIESC28_02420 [Fusarium coffeatum]KAI1056951.1 hypothetical protein LB507_002582 [Fusarium sp. FIESC RH6]KAJ4006916.1 hypothetical protein NW766_010324 [Fusarium irregulare]KAJ4028740.1 hypothetical protein NW752_001002 [Fusarium irregulare]RBR24759.1 hypothetical protein FIESC28_02420 [Fusarium coffeatum]